LFYLGQLSHFLSCFGAGVTNLNEPPSSFLLSPHYCGLGAGFIPFRAIVNNKQCEMRGLFMSLVIHYWIGDVQDCQGVSTSEMTYIVSSGALNSTHSLTRSTGMSEEWRSEGVCLCFYDSVLNTDSLGLVFLFLSTTATVLDKIDVNVMGKYIF